jgi:hypothetical protein
VRNRLTVSAAACLIVGLAACGSTSSPTASKTTATLPRPAPTTTTLPSQSIDATGQAYLMHSGTNGFKLYGGTLISATLGKGQFVEDGTFLATPKNPSWTAHGTLTAADGDTVTFTSVGGIQSQDKQGKHSTTTETITGGTGKFSGATGTMHTTGVTVILGTGNVVIQLYKFGFHGTITERAA